MNFSTKTRNIKHDAEMIITVSNRVNDLESHVGNVKNALSYSSSMDGIIRNLDIQMKNLEKLALRTNDMGRKLENICMLYVRTENELIGKAGNPADVPEEKQETDTNAAYNKIVDLLNFVKKKYEEWNPDFDDLVKISLLTFAVLSAGGSSSKPVEEEKTWGEKAKEYALLTAELGECQALELELWSFRKMIEMQLNPGIFSSVTSSYMPLNQLLKYGTVTVGINGNAGAGIGVGDTIQVAIDGKGNIVLQNSYAVEMDLGAGGSANLVVTFFPFLDAPNTAGGANYVGGNIEALGGAGVDIVRDENGNYGVAVSVGIGGGIEAHFGGSHTDNLAEINILDLIDSAIEEVDNQEAQLKQQRDDLNFI